MGGYQSRTVEELYRANAKKMYSVACRLTGSSETAEDLVQEAFLLYLSRAERLAGHPNPEGWLMVTLQNLIRNELRQTRATDLSLEEIGKDLTAPEHGAKLWETLPADLLKEDRQLLIWRYEEELGHREIADRLGVPEGTVRSRLSRLLRKLKRNDKLFDHSNAKCAAKPPGSNMFIAEAGEEGRQ